MWYPSNTLTSNDRLGSVVVLYSYRLNHEAVGVGARRLVIADMLSRSPRPRGATGDRGMKIQ